MDMDKEDYICSYCGEPLSTHNEVESEICADCVAIGIIEPLEEMSVLDFSEKDFDKFPSTSFHDCISTTMDQEEEAK